MISGQVTGDDIPLVQQTPFTAPDVADDELVLAEQLLAGVGLRATTLITHIAALTRADVDNRASVQGA